MAICECGCGLPTTVAIRSDPRRGQIKGQPCRFRPSHRYSGGRTSRYRTVKTETGYQWEHIVIAQRVLGRPLPKGAEVHHVDGNPRNNALINLVICENHAYHYLLHVRARIVKAGGNPNTDKVCSRCHQPRPLTVFRRQPNGKGTFGRHDRCHDCEHAFLKARYARKKASAA